MGEALNPVKTNVIRLLEAEHIVHKVHTYDADEALDATSVAQWLGVEPERIFKTLVTSGGGTVHLVFCLPSVLSLNLRRAATVGGCRTVELIAPDELLGLTGYVRGGCSPLAMKKSFPTYIEETAQLFDTILISAGLRGLQVELSPSDLVTLGTRLLPRMEFASFS